MSLSKRLSSSSKRIEMAFSGQERAQRPQALQEAPITALPSRISMASTKQDSAQRPQPEHKAGSTDSSMPGRGAEGRVEGRPTPLKVLAVEAAAIVAEADEHEALEARAEGEGIDPDVGDIGHEAGLLGAAHVGVGLLAARAMADARMEALDVGAEGHASEIGRLVRARLLRPTDAGVEDEKVVGLGDEPLDEVAGQGEILRLGQGYAYRDARDEAVGIGEKRRDDPSEEGKGREELAEGDDGPGKPHHGLHDLLGRTVAKGILHRLPDREGAS